MCVFVARVSLLSLFVGWWLFVVACCLLVFIFCLLSVV